VAGPELRAVDSKAIIVIVEGGTKPKFLSIFSSGNSGFCGYGCFPKMYLLILRLRAIFRNVCSQSFQLKGKVSFVTLLVFEDIFGLVIRYLSARIDGQ
jgi:hypothetical protein